MYIFLYLFAWMVGLPHPAHAQDVYTHLRNHQYQEAYACAVEQVLADPQNPENLLSLGYILKKLNRYQQAIAVYEYARPFVTHPSTLERALSGAYLALGDFCHGWPAYEYRWVQPPAYNQELKSYLAKGNALRNKIVVLKAEYGLGDTLQFIRYARVLKNAGSRVILECQKQLIPLLSLCPYIDEIHPQGAVIPGHFFALLMSMPLILDTKLESIPQAVPYLYADPTLVRSWKDKVNSPSSFDKAQELRGDLFPSSLTPRQSSGVNARLPAEAFGEGWVEGATENTKNKKITRRFNIGICWQADPHTNTAHQTVILDAQAKSINLGILAQLADMEQVKLYSLQKVNGLEHRHPKIHYFDELDTTNGPFMDTAALMHHLDLIITIDTSIAHLAGGLGVPCWVLLNAGADWRWMVDRNDSPWYPTMRLFRQKTPGDWESVIHEVKKAILNKTGKR